MAVTYEYFIFFHLFMQSVLQRLNFQKKISLLCLGCIVLLCGTFNGVDIHWARVDF